jgi:rhamnogalacturonan acetylesterase
MLYFFKNKHLQNRWQVWWPVVILFLTAFSIQKSRKPVLYIIGDSTVKNGDGSGKNGQWGWGSLASEYFDTTRISIQNHAIGGRSSRTFITEKRWDRILADLKKGDFVLIQFGHNDGGALDDTARARGSIKGIGNDSVDIYNPIRKQREIVYSYGKYMRTYVNDCKLRGAIPIICSPVPRNNKVQGKIPIDNYATWSKEIAIETRVAFIPLSSMIAETYNTLDSVTLNKLFYGDHTHTSLEGAKLNVEMVVQGIKDIKRMNLRKYLWQR